MKLAHVFLLVALLAAPTVAQSIYVPDNNPAGGPCSTQPLNNGASWRYLYVVNNQTMGNQALKILEVAFAPCATTMFTATQFQMRMSHTTTSITGPQCFDTFLGSTPIVVYDGPLQWNATKDTWSPIGLQTPFVYDGTRNLVIEFRFRGAPSSGNGLSVRIDTGALSLTVDPNMSKDPYTEKCGNQIRGVVKSELRYATLGLLFGPEQVRVGTTAFFRLTGNPGEGYQLASSLGQGRLNVGSCTIGLDMDPLFFASLTVGAPVFTEFAGVLSPGGTAGASLAVPNIQALVGTAVYHAGVTYTTAVTGCYNTIGTVIVQ